MKKFKYFEGSRCCALLFQHNIMKNKHISGIQFTTLSCLINRVLSCVKHCRVNITKRNVEIISLSIKRKYISTKQGTTTRL